MNTNETQIKPLNLGTGEHDWPYKYPHYFGQCVQCGEMYSGLKRSIWCYTCDRKDNE